jgi:peptidoglycan hydrolase-like protein with peptidoglycan-binding domain
MINYMRILLQFILILVLATAAAANCSSLSLNQCTDKTLCYLAVEKSQSVYRWSTLDIYKPYVREAKSRGLDCVAEQSFQISRTDTIKAEEKSKLPWRCTDETDKHFRALGKSTIKIIQTKLSEKGFNPNGIDGMVGPGTRQAIARWQNSKGYAETEFLTYAQELELLGFALTDDPSCDLRRIEKSEQTANASSALSNISTNLEVENPLELIVEHSNVYDFDPYECAFQLTIGSAGQPQQATFYYQPERKKYVANVSLSLSDFKKLNPSELTFSSAEGSYCSPTGAIDKTFNVNGANSIEFPNISLITTKAIEIVVSNQEKPQTSSQTQKSSLFETLLPENNEDTLDQTSEKTFELLQQNKILEELLENTNEQISVLAETVRAFERDKSSWERELDELASINHSLNFELDELRVSLATSLLNYTGSQTELKNALVEIDFLSAEVIRLQNEIQKLIEIDTENIPNGNGSDIKEAFLKKELQKLREALETEKARAAKEYALRLKLEQQLDN